MTGQERADELSKFYGTMRLPFNLMLKRMSRLVGQEITPPMLTNRIMLTALARSREPFGVKNIGPVPTIPNRTNRRNRNRKLNKVSERVKKKIQIEQQKILKHETEKVKEQIKNAGSRSAP